MQQVATQTQALVTSQQNEIMAVRLKLKLKVKLNRKNVCQQVLASSHKVISKATW